MKTAVLIDGGYFLKRIHQYYRLYKIFDPTIVANLIHSHALEHISQDEYSRENNLYRIFFYDCPPISLKYHLPISKKSIDYSKTDQAMFRNTLHKCLKAKRKVALRLGRINESQIRWILKPNPTKELLNGKRDLSSLKDEDFYLNIHQKMIDMKIGLDIASIAHKQQVGRIILISGDSDFVPAAKQARREGIDFILDGMKGHIHEDLFEHIDGLKSVYVKNRSYLIDLGSSSKCNSDDRNRIIQKVYEKQESYEVDG